MVSSHYALNCYMGVWDEGVSGSIEERNTIINLATRKTGCFFFLHHPDMLFKAAQELQKRAEENQQLKRAHVYTRLGLWVAAGALAINALVEFFKSAP